jgi:hypothetical protein
VRRSASVSRRPARSSSSSSGMSITSMIGRGRAGAALADLLRRARLPRRPAREPVGVPPARPVARPPAPRLSGNARGVTRSPPGTTGPELRNRRLVLGPARSGPGLLPLHRASAACSCATSRALSGRSSSRTWSTSPTNPPAGWSPSGAMSAARHRDPRRCAGGARAVRARARPGPRARAGVGRRGAADRRVRRARDAAYGLTNVANPP